MMSQQNIVNQETKNFNNNNTVVEPTEFSATPVENGGAITSGNPHEQNMVYVPNPNEQLISVDTLKKIEATQDLVDLIGVSARNPADLNEDYHDYETLLTALYPLTRLTIDNLVKMYQETLAIDHDKTMSSYIKQTLLDKTHNSQVIRNADMNEGWGFAGHGQAAGWGSNMTIHKIPRIRVDLSDATQPDNNVEHHSRWDEIYWRQYSGFPGVLTRLSEQFQNTLDKGSIQYEQKTKGEFAAVPKDLWQDINSIIRADSRITFLREAFVLFTSMLVRPDNGEYLSPNENKRNRLFFLDRKYLEQDAGRKLVSIASDEQTLVFPYKTRRDVMTCIELVANYMIYFEHETDFLLVFPNFEGFSDLERVKSFTYAEGCEAMTRYMGGKIHGLLTWINITYRAEGWRWRGSVDPNHNVDVEDGHSALLVVQVIRNSLSGAYEQDIIQYGYEENYNYTTWLRVAAAIANLAFPEYTAVIQIARAALEPITSGNKYHATHFQWHVYPRKFEAIKINVCDWMALLDMYNEIFVEIHEPDQRIYLANLKFVKDQIRNPDIYDRNLLGYEYDVSAPLCSRFTRIGKYLGMNNYANATYVTIPISLGHYAVTDIANPISTRGYIKYVLRRIFVELNYGSMLNCAWINDSEMTEYRLAYEACSNYCLVPTRENCTAGDYAFIDTLIYSKYPGQLQRYEGGNIEDEFQFYPADISQPAQLDGVVIEELFIPEIEWPDAVYGPCLYKTPEPVYSQDFALLTAQDDGIYYCWNGKISGTWDWNVTNINEDHLPNLAFNIITLSHLPANGAAKIRIPNLLTTIAPECEIKLRLTPPLQNNIPTVWQQFAFIPTRWERYGAPVITPSGRKSTRRKFRQLK